MDWEWGVLGALLSGLIIYAVIARRRANRAENFVGRFWRRCFPELDLFDSHATRWSAFSRAQMNWSTILVMVTMAILALVAMNVVDDVLKSRLPHPFVSGSINAVILLGMIHSGLWLTKKRISRRLREELIEDGFAICRSCGYDLRASKERCPECGEGFSS